MACLYREILVDASPDHVWDAVKDVGSVHTRLAHGFVVDTKLEDGARIVTFANRMVVRKLIVDISDEHRRLAYIAVGGRASHHNASIQVFPAGEGKARLLWVTDLLPNEMAAPIAAMVELGSAAVKRALERVTPKA